MTETIRIADPAEISAVAAAARAIPPENFDSWRGGWPDEIATALLDAVFSMRAVYDSGSDGRGVLGRVRMFRGRHEDVVNDLAALTALGEEPIREIMGGTKTAQRRKSDVVVETAAQLADAGVVTADDFLTRDAAGLRNIYTGVRGLGPETFEYFSMLLGRPGVKADRMIVRFVHDALDRDASPAEARELVTAAYEQLSAEPEHGFGETLTHFEHGLWRAGSVAARRGD